MDEEVSSLDLARMVRKWQRRIRPLKAWKIAIRFGAEEELNDEGCKMYGWVTYDEDTLTAEILIRPTALLVGMNQYPLEETVLHEMLHIVWDNVEQGINMVAEALMEAYPKRKRKGT